MFEGIDGSGKSTALKAAEKAIRAHGFNVTCLKQPSTGPYGKQFRKVAHLPLNANFANTMLIKDRVWDVAKNILPALRRGDVVLLDRYYYSHIYQAGTFTEALPILLHNRQRFPLPNLTLLFDVSPLVARRRIVSSRRGLERLERQLSNTRLMYHKMISFPEVKFINAGCKLDDVKMLVVDSILRIIIKHRSANDY